MLDEIPNGNEIKEKIKEYIEMQAQDWQLPITEAEELEFKKICDDNTITFNDPMEGAAGLNYYDLKLLQHDAYLEVASKEKILFKEMETKIRVKE